MTRRIAVLASGGGSNLQAILDHLDSLGQGAGAQVALVASDRPDAGALARARGRSIATVVLDEAARTSGLTGLLVEHGIDVIALAGYFRFVPTDTTARFRGRIVNVHPALLPAFGGRGMYGQRVHDAVLAAGARVSGVTVHFVDEQYDHGAIIAQWPVPVFESDSGEDLQRRVLAIEHALYPRVVHAIAAGRVTLDGDGRVRGAFEAPLAGQVFTLARRSESPSAAVDAIFAVRADIAATRSR